MNDLITKETLRQLAEAQATPSVSLYLPTYPMGSGTQQNAVLLRNLLDRTEEQLLGARLRRPDVAALLQPARDRQEDADYWQNQSEGLAVFLAPDQAFFFRVPISFDERIRIADRFHVKPLLPYFSEDGRFYILALSQANVRLFQATRYRVDPVKLDHVPTSLAEALKFDDKDRQMELPTGASGSHGGRGAAPMFHGHGSAANDPKNDLLRFFQQLDAGVSEILRNEHAPLVLAGVEYLHPIYAAATSYRDLVPEGIKGNPDQMSGEELHAAAWPIVEPIFHSARASAIANYYDLLSHQRAASTLEEILPAAYTGRINTAFTAIGRQRWGTFNEQTYELQYAAASTATNEDLINLVAIQTILHDGEVFALPPEEMPDGREVAAVYRY